MPERCQEVEWHAHMCNCCGESRCWEEKEWRHEMTIGMEWFSGAP